LDKLHEDLKDIYVPNQEQKPEEKKDVLDWSEIGEKN
jgi:hypothetical protein